MSWVCGLRYSGQAFLVPDPWAKFSTSYQYRITVTNTNIGRKKSTQKLSQIKKKENEIEKHCHKYKFGGNKIENNCYKCRHKGKKYNNKKVSQIQIFWDNFD